MAKAKEAVELSLREKLGYAKSEDGIDCSKDEVLTEQHHADELDINKIIERYSPEELAASAADVVAGYGDFANIDDYHTMMSKVAQANESFMALPAEIRRRFNNQPTELMDFLNEIPKNEKLYDEAYALGLVKNQRVPKEAGKPADKPVAGTEK